MLDWIRGQDLGIVYMHTGQLKRSRKFPCNARQRRSLLDTDEVQSESNQLVPNYHLHRCSNAALVSVPKLSTPCAKVRESCGCSSDQFKRLACNPAILLVWANQTKLTLTRTKNRVLDSSFHPILRVESGDLQVLSIQTIGSRCYHKPS